MELTRQGGGKTIPGRRNSEGEVLVVRRIVETTRDQRKGNVSEMRNQRGTWNKPRLES